MPLQNRYRRLHNDERRQRTQQRPDNKKAPSLLWEPETSRFCRNRGWTVSSSALHDAESDTENRTVEDAIGLRDKGGGGGIGSSRTRTGGTSTVAASASEVTVASEKTGVSLRSGDRTGSKGEQRVENAEREARTSPPAASQPVLGDEQRGGADSQLSSAESTSTPASPNNSREGVMASGGARRLGKQGDGEEEAGSEEGGQVSGVDVLGQAETSTGPMTEEEDGFGEHGWYAPSGVTEDGIG